MNTKKVIASTAAGAAVLLSALFAAPGQALAATPFAAEYFTNDALTGTPAVTRNDVAVDFVWGAGSPDPAIPNNHFSARWTKSQYFEYGVYRFSMRSDDGARLYVDNVLKIDDWGPHANHLATGDIELTEGFHTIKMEYREVSGGALAKLTWRLFGPQPETGYLAKFWNFPASQVPSIPNAETTPPVLQTSYGAVDFDWGNGSPGAGVNSDFFVTEFKANKLFEAGTYQFIATTDDGVRLYIDGERIIDEWNDNSSNTFMATKRLTAGIHRVKLEFFERGGGAKLKFDYNKLATNEIRRFAVRCFNNIDLANTAVYTASTQFIKYNFGAGSPAPQVNNDNFSCRFTKNQEFSAGNHKFTVTADDGFRLFIDNVKVYDKWYDGAASTHVINKTLTAGVHNVRLEYYERGGGALLTYIEQ